MDTYGQFRMEGWILVRYDLPVLVHIVSRKAKNLKRHVESLTGENFKVSKMASREGGELTDY